MNNLKYEYSSVPELREDQDYNYIEKTILSLLQEQKVSFKQAKEIFAAIESRLTERIENEYITKITGNRINDITIEGGNINVPKGMTL